MVSSTKSKTILSKFVWLSWWPSWADSMSNLNDPLGCVQCDGNGCTYRPVASTIGASTPPTIQRHKSSTLLVFRRSESCCLRRRTPCLRHFHGVYASDPESSIVPIVSTAIVIITCFRLLARSLAWLLINNFQIGPKTDISTRNVNEEAKMPAKESNKRPSSFMNSLGCETKRLNSFKWSKIFNTYTHLVFHYPLLILISCLLLCTIVPIFVLLFYPVQLDNNPEKVCFLLWSLIIQMLLGLQYSKHGSFAQPNGLDTASAIDSARQFKSLYNFFKMNV